MSNKESDAPLPFDSVPNARNKWQVFRGNRVFGRWRHEDGKKVFVCGPIPTHGTHQLQQMDTASFAATKSSNVANK
jgi:hypothetical protein